MTVWEEIERIRTYSKLLMEKVSHSKKYWIRNYSDLIILKSDVEIIWNYHNTGRHKESTLGPMNPTLAKAPSKTGPIRYRWTLPLLIVFRSLNNNSDNRSETLPARPEPAPTQTHTHIRQSIAHTVDQMRKWNCHFDGRGAYEFLGREREL